MGACVSCAGLLEEKDVIFEADRACAYVALQVVPGVQGISRADFRGMERRAGRSWV